MKKSEMKELIRSAIIPQSLCKVQFKYDLYARYFFPFQVSDKFFLAAEQDDFLIDGFTIRRFSDVSKVQIENDKRVEIIKMEGLLDGLTPPEIDLSDWHSVFLSLMNQNRNIIVEKESLNDDEWEYAIGYIEKVMKNKIVFRHFDAEGIWQESPYEIPFSQITSVTFGSRYVEIFSKYV